MADCLRTWIEAEQAGQPALVECPRSVERRLLLRRQIRSLDGCPQEVVDTHLVQLGLASQVEGRSQTNAQLRAMFAGDDPDAVGTVPVALAIAELERMVAARWRIADAA
jgi:hypothetical protein